MHDKYIIIHKMHDNDKADACVPQQGAMQTACARSRPRRPVWRGNKLPECSPEHQTQDRRAFRGGTAGIGTVLSCKNVFRQPAQQRCPLPQTRQGRHDAWSCRPWTMGDELPRAAAAQRNQQKMETPVWYLVSSTMILMSYRPGLRPSLEMFILSMRSSASR